MVLWYWVNFQCRSVILSWIRVWQGPTALAVGAGGGVWSFFSLGPDFLAHLSHRLRVSYCHWPMSVVRRALSVVRRQQLL